MNLQEDLEGKVVGAVITGFRYMTKKEMESEGWDRPALVLVLDTGVKLYASRDDEGNGPGAMFGTYKNKKFQLP